MSNQSTFRMSIGIAATLAAAFVATAQDAPKGFTARELFYSAEEPNAKPVAKTTGKPAQPVVQTPTKRPPSTQVATTGDKPASTTHTSRPPSTVTASRMQSASASTPDGSPIIRAADGGPDRAPAPTNGPALGLKITVLKRIGNEDVEVAPDTVFHAGDRIRFSVQTNSPGYLYIVNQGSSGTWKPLFPSQEIAEGDNRVDGWHPYVMPPKSRMVFDEQTGTEKVFIVFSKEPEAEFDNMVYSLPGNQAVPGPQGAPPTKPVSQPQSPSRPSKGVLVTASASLPDSAIDKMRRTYSRDLIIERVDDTTPSTPSASPAEKKEKAVYVVNPSGSSDPRVVADLQLIHQ